MNAPTRPVEVAPASASGAAMIERARALQPMIAAAAQRIDEERQVSRDVVDALHAAGMFRMLLPRELGGHEMNADEFVQVIEIIATADGSTAWCLCQGSGCSLAAAHLPEAVAADIFRPGGVVAWGFGPQGKAIETDGGHKVTGAWQFASGNRHATHLGGHSIVCAPDGTPRLDTDGRPMLRTFLFPRSSATVLDNWNVMGLRGTGSDSYKVEGLLVPAGYSMLAPHNYELSTEAGSRRHDGPLYRFGSTPLYAAGFAAVGLGIARGALDAFIPLAMGKQGATGASIMRDNAVIQSRVGQSEAQLESARSFLYDSVHRMMRAVEANGTPDIGDRVRLRLASTYGINQARTVVDTCFNLAGATALFTDKPFERRFRDVNAVSQQIQGHVVHFETVGQHLMGLQPNTRFL